MGLLRDEAADRDPLVAERLEGRDRLRVARGAPALGDADRLERAAARAVAREELLRRDRASAAAAAATPGGSRSSLSGGCSSKPRITWSSEIPASTPQPS